MARASPKTTIERLVAARREVGVLRRALAAHRSALTALTHPELEALGNDASGERFESLLRRFEATVQEARDARESTVGSFDVLIARTGHRTNDIMKVLTLTSVILLPGALIAGLMGMNFKVGLFEVTWPFYIVVALVASNRHRHAHHRKTARLDLADEVLAHRAKTFVISRLFVGVAPVAAGAFLAPSASLWESGGPDAIG